MSFTFLAKSCAYSWKMSLDGQVLWKRNDAVCATATMGADIAPAATAAPFSRLRRRGLFWAVMQVSFDVGFTDGLSLMRPLQAVIGFSPSTADVRRDS